MATPPSLNSRQQLHLHIDPFTYSKSQSRFSPQSPSSLLADIDASLGTSDISPSEPSTICSVLCMYDYRSDDPDHLSFSKNEILDVVKMEESGWWAALRSDGDQVGWIPQAYVNTISSEMAEKLRNIRPELRGYEYGAEQLYTSVSTHPIHSFHDFGGTSFPITQKQTGAHNRPQTPSSYLPLSKAPDNSYSSSFFDPPYRQMFKSRRPSREQSHSAMPPPPYTSFHDKATIFPPSSSEEDVPQPRGNLPIHHVKHRPSITNDNLVSSRIRPLHEAGSLAGFSTSTSPEGVKHSRSLRPEADIPAQPSPVPHPHLKPLYSDQLGMDADGLVLYGTVEALVEKLTSDYSSLDHTKAEVEALFRNIFLMTFRTFTTADVFFDMLVERYRMAQTEDLAVDPKNQFVDTQRSVLMIFTMWLEDYRLLDEDTQIAALLTDFLRSIVSPPLASMARLLTKSIQRLTFAIPANPSPIAPPRKVRKSKVHKNDLLKLDPIEIAEQLTLLEFHRYNKVTPQECLRHAAGKQNVGNLSTFCSTHDEVAFWVKMSILKNDALGKRADTIDFWIKVAEKCKILNNFSSMSAIITGLSSTVIAQLRLTWTHIGRNSIYDSLSRYNDPSGSFAGYRSLLRNVEGPCIPFIIMFLTEMVHINDQYIDEGSKLCFTKRQKWYEVIFPMLRFQSRSYEIAENESIMGFITKHLRDPEDVSRDWFWSRSRDIQNSEMAHADIGRRLEAAGF